MYGRYSDEYWKTLSIPVDQLIGGEAHIFCRYLLPDDHPMRRTAGPGGMSDYLVLGTDDVLRPCVTGSFQGQQMFGRVACIDDHM